MNHHRRPISAPAISVAVLALALALTPAIGAGAPSESSSTHDRLVQHDAFVPAAFRRAQVDDRLILLVLDAPWSARSRAADEMLWTHQALNAWLGERAVVIHERADLRPDLAARYAGPGLPAMTILLPDGTPLAYAPSDSAAATRLVTSRIEPEALLRALREADAYYRADRAAAVKASREAWDRDISSQRPESREKSSEAAVMAAASRLESIYDATRRYFGGAPRVPRPDEIELLATLGRAQPDTFGAMALDSLGEMLTHLVDPDDGGLRSGARGLDWSEPVPEKLLETNARVLEVLALARELSDDPALAKWAGSLAGFLVSGLGADGGGFRAASGPACQAGGCEVVLSGPTGLAAAALIRAGKAFGKEAWTRRGLEAARYLEQERYSRRRGLPRAVVDGYAVPPGNILLEDLAGAAWAFLAAYDATGEEHWREAAEDLASTAARNLRDPASGMFSDIVVSDQGPVPLQDAILPVKANARLVRVMTRLAAGPGSRSARGQGDAFRRVSEDVLAALAGGSRGRDIGEECAFALAAREFYAHPQQPKKEGNP